MRRNPFARATIIIVAAFAAVTVQGRALYGADSPSPPAIEPASSPSAAASSAHLVSAIDVGDFGSEALRLGDLDLDGQPDLLFVQSVFETREITCLTATDIHGRILWRWGKPSAENGRIYSDLPVQVHDWDGDGRNEVVRVRQARYLDPPFRRGEPRERATRYEGDATLVVCEGRTGRELSTLPIPAPADDSILFADLTGRGRPADLVVKDRYWNAWGVSHEGRVLWRWSGSTGHYPAAADIDSDGRDEVFFGFALIDDDGREMFSRDPGGAHQDACYLLRPGDGRWRLLFGNGGLHCLGADGTELWARPMGECQHVVAGRFRPGDAPTLVSIDRTPDPSHRRDENAWAILYLFDLEGKELWRVQQPKGAWAIAPVRARWNSARGTDDILIYGRGPGRPAVILDGRGEVLETLPLATPPDAAGEPRADFYGLAADVWGDGRDEVILFGSRGACIWANGRLDPDPALFNENFYQGM